MCNSWRNVKMELKEYFKRQTLRIKITNKCNLRCPFCHGEGGFKELDEIEPNSEFKAVITQICLKHNIKDFVITGGEPLLHPKLIEIVSILKSFQSDTTVRIVTNGTIGLSEEQWSSLFDAGVRAVTMSINDIHGPYVETQLANLKFIRKRNILAKVNIVATDINHVKESVKLLSASEPGINIVLLNNIYERDKSENVVKQFLHELKAEEIGYVERRNTSNKMKEYMIPGQACHLYVKTFYKYKHELYCRNCNEVNCYEGYYGMRLEKYKGRYYIRTCLQRDDNRLRIDNEMR